MEKKNIKLNWCNNVFLLTEEKEEEEKEVKEINWIGHDFTGVYTTQGKSFLMPDSMCVQIKKKNKKSIRTVLRFRRAIGKQGYYYNFLMYFVMLGWFKVNKKIFPKNVNLSRITKKRFIK